MTNCPRCQIPIDREMAECPRCGVIFDKWRQREDNLQQGNIGRYQNKPSQTSSEFNWVILGIICAVMIGIIYFLDKF